ncbi:MAG: hypothetical protein ACHQET_13200 [Chitinophagales bacterium]
MTESFNIFLLNVKRAAFLVIMILFNFQSSSAQKDRRTSDRVYLSDSGSHAASAENSTEEPKDSSHDEENHSEEDSTQFRSVPDSVLASFHKDKDFAYANDPSFWVRKPVKKENNFLNDFFEWASSKSFRTILYVLIASLLVFALYKIVVENKMYIFYSPPSDGASAAKLDIDMDPVDLDGKIRQAILENDLNSATRWMYLKTLKIVNEAGLINFNMQSTSQDYVQQMQSSPLANDFSFLSRVFEKVCYGGFSLTWVQFHSVKNRFEQFFIQTGSLK